MTPWYLQMGVATLAYSLLHVQVYPGNEPTDLKDMPHPASKEFSYMVGAALMFVVFAWPLVLFSLFVDVIKKGKFL